MSRYKFGDMVLVRTPEGRTMGVVVGFTGLRDSDEQGYVVALKPHYLAPVKHNVNVLESELVRKISVKESDMSLI